MGISQKNLLELMKKTEINGSDLVLLLEARQKKTINFVLVDIREQSEYDKKRIVGVDYLLPTSSFYDKSQEFEKHKEDTIILQCHSGGRSFQIQQMLKNMGYKNVVNLKGGISLYTGNTI